MLVSFILARAIGILGIYFTPRIISLAGCEFSAAVIGFLQASMRFRLKWFEVILEEEMDSPRHQSGEASLMDFKGSWSLVSGFRFQVSW